MQELLVKGSPAARGEDHVLFNFKRGELPAGASQGLKRRREVTARRAVGPAHGRPGDAPARRVKGDVCGATNAGFSKRQNLRDSGGGQKLVGK